MSNNDTQLVIAYFDSFDQANTAAKELKNWDTANEDIQLGAIGVLHQADNGKIKTKKYGQHNTGSGAKIGLLLGVLAALLPAVGLVGGVMAGTAGGGIFGSFSRKGLGLSDEALAHIKTELAGGKAALAVLAPTVDVEPIAAQLTSLGGTAETHDGPTEEIQQVADAVNAPDPDEIEGVPVAAWPQP